MNSYEKEKLIENMNEFMFDFGYYDYEIVDEDEDVLLNMNSDFIVRQRRIPTIPVPFGTINGHFIIENCGLSSLKNSPRVVKNKFKVNANYSLSTLLHGPRIIESGYICCWGNRLSTLDGLPFSVDFNVTNLQEDIIDNNRFKDEKEVKKEVQKYIFKRVFLDVTFVKDKLTKEFATPKMIEMFKPFFIAAAFDLF